MRATQPTDLIGGDKTIEQPLEKLSQPKQDPQWVDDKSEAHPASNSGNVELSRQQARET